MQLVNLVRSRPGLKINLLDLYQPRAKFMKYYLTLCVALFLFSTNLLADVERETYQLQAFQQQIIESEKVSFTVPENRAKENSRQLKLYYVRLPSLAKNPGNPIVYLSGGPGGSATEAATYPRFVLFQALRQQADVILFDQRGTGLSDQLDDCQRDPTSLFMQPLTQPSLNAYLAEKIPECVSEWQQKNYDLHGYNTQESANDLLALQKVLGAEKLDFLAISYGTHLALATAKYHPNIIGKMVLASSEGLDQTIKLPAESDKLLEALNQLWQSQTGNKQQPDLISMMRAVHSRLEKSPVLVSVKHPQTQQDIQLTVSELDVQLITSFIFLKNPDNQAGLPAFYQAMYAGDFQQAATYSMAIKGQMGQFNPMAYAMDAASGISPKRWSAVQKQSAKAVLGRSTNLPFPEVNQWLKVNELDENFRAKFKSNLPVLFLIGDRDGRTFVAEQLEAAKQFSHAKKVLIRGGGHDSFLTNAQVADTIGEFLAGKLKSSPKIRIPEPLFKEQ
jgi:pimeloyl-ACP methyl ester carboxylesterase